MSSIASFHGGGGLGGSGSSRGYSGGGGGGGGGGVAGMIGPGGVRHGSSSSLADGVRDDISFTVSWLVGRGCDRTRSWGGGAEVAISLL